jgi:hypothetical protein
MPTRRPSDRNFAANTALPQPPSTSQKVPNISAASRCNMVGVVIITSTIGIASFEGDTLLLWKTVSVAQLCREGDGTKAIAAQVNLR